MYNTNTLISYMSWIKWRCWYFCCNLFKPIENCRFKIFKQQFYQIYISSPMICSWIRFLSNKLCVLSPRLGKGIKTHHFDINHIQQQIMGDFFFIPCFILHSQCFTRFLCKTPLYFTIYAKTFMTPQLHLAGWYQNNIQWIIY